jgi:hypothetical protein
MKNFYRSLAAVFGGLLYNMVPVMSLAQGLSDGTVPTDLQTKIQNFTGLGTTSPEDVTVNIINVSLGFLALIAVIIILYAGFTWMTAAGNDDKISRAKQMLFAAVVGLLIIMAAWAITLFVIYAFADATGTTVT